MEFPQLNVVESASGFFTITCNKRHCSATVQQVYCGFNLMVMDFDFQRDLVNDFLHIVVNILRKLTLRLGIVPQQSSLFRPTLGTV